MSDITVITDYMEMGTCGRRQLREALQLAEQRMMKHSKAFIAGKDENDRVMVAPMSERMAFCEPLSCIVDRSGYWNPSDIHSLHIFNPHDRMPATDDAKAMKAYREQGCIYRMYEGPSYGRFDVDKADCITRLQCALEDAAKMPKCRIGILSDVMIFVDRGGDILDPRQEFMVDGILQIQKIKETAQKTYNKILKDHTASN